MGSQGFNGAARISATRKAIALNFQRLYNHFIRKPPHFIIDSRKVNGPAEHEVRTTGLAETGVLTVAGDMSIPTICSELNFGTVL